TGAGAAGRGVVRFLWRTRRASGRSRTVWHYVVWRQPPADRDWRSTRPRGLVEQYRALGAVTNSRPCLSGPADRTLRQRLACPIRLGTPLWPRTAQRRESPDVSRDPARRGSSVSRAAGASRRTDRSSGAAAEDLKRSISVRRTRPPLSARERPCWRTRRSTR